MITDFNEIKNEKDRALYVEYRNILDNMFLQEIEKHKNKDHCFADCTPEIQEELMSGFPTRLKQEVKETGESESIIITDWIYHNQVNCWMYLDCLRILHKELSKRSS